MLHIKVKKLRPEAMLPRYATLAAAGADVFACLPENGALDGAVRIAPGARKLIPTGLAFEIPVGFEIQVRPRSGLALKNGITVLNAPGTIDADYRGDLGVILANYGDTGFSVQHGDRIAQIVVAPLLRGMWQVADELSATGRGDGGFGHTGVR